MAKFEIQKLKYGYEGSSFTYSTSISGIVFEEEDETVTLPSIYEGEEITHLAYGQRFDPAHEEWADWHHPSKGCDYVPDKYSHSLKTFVVPEHVKKIVIPASIRDICYCAFKCLGNTKIEIDPQNTVYTTDENGKIVRRK